MQMSEYVVELKNATKRFPGVVALRNMQLAVKPGEILGLIGENGAGKSTLIKVLTGVHQADEGQIFVDGVEQHFKDPNDEKNIYVEIRGGAGGEESALFAADLYRMYTMYADRRGWQTEVMSRSETELGGYKEIVFRVAGDRVYSRLKFESGVHRVQRVPETESQGRVHTSTTTVAVLPEAEELDFYIDPKDLRIDTFRASGAGGQHINKTSSAIRVTHIPTNTVVECQDERSQHKNKEKALSVLRSRLYEAEVEKQRAAIAADRKSQVGTGDRSERIRTYNFPENRVSDHRIKLTIYKLDQFLNGDMDEILDALIAADTAEKLRQQSEA